MIPIFVWILLALIINSLLGFVGILTFWIRERTLNRILIYFVAFSAGALLGGAFFHLFPESLEHLPSMDASALALVGFILFLLIEGFFHWHQCERCNIHPFSYMMLIGDGIHNFIDGLVVAATFFMSIHLGIITTTMILLHEAPQELGLFGTLIYAGLDKNRSLLYSWLAQSTCILGGLVGYFISSVSSLSPFLAAFAAGGFLYVAASDLVPEIHKIYKGNLKRSLLLISFLIIGIIFMASIGLLGR